ncbi:MAG: RluA family pseudouridine synthase [Castellaniella sp.]
MEPRARIVEVDAGHAGQRLDNFLLRLCKGVPKSHIYKAIRSGEVRVNRGRARATTRLACGDQVRVPPMRMAPVEQARWVPPAVFPVIFEDESLLVIDKPAGVAVHGGSGVAFGVIEQLRAARPPGAFLELAHRLDRETSGVLVLAKRRTALLGVQEALRDAQCRRCYDAFVEGDWVNERQHLRQPLLRWLTAQGERRVRVDPEGKRAHTIVSLRRRLGPCSWVQAELRTGRTHQIRVHLAHAGHPVLCDDKYGSASVREHYRERGYRRMFLHASMLEMVHPRTGATMCWQAALPEDFGRLINELENEQ